MSIVMVDVPQFVVDLAGAVEPRSVRLSISGVTAGQSFTVTGSAGGFTWAVRGGSGAVPSTGTVILTDAASPLNVAITYTLTLEGVPYTAGPITVPYDGRYVLQSLDGRTVVPFRWHDNRDPRDQRMRTSVLEIPGRSTPVVRWDVSAGQSRRLVIRTTPAATRVLLDRLNTHGPVLLLRTDGTLRDFAPASYLALTAAPDQLFGVEGERLWSLSVEVIDDPEPGTILASATWDDFDAVYAPATWDDFDAEWADADWDEFDRTDWTQY